MLSEHFHVRIARVLPSQFGIVHAYHTMIRTISIIAVHSVSVVSRVMMRMNVVILVAMILVMVQVLCMVVMIVIAIVGQRIETSIQFVHEQAAATIAACAKFWI